MLNSQRTTARILLVIGVAGFLAVVAVPLFDIDIFAGGGAMMLVGLMVGLTGLIAGWMFHSRARTLDRIREGAEILVRWEYDADTWSSFARVDVRESAGELHGMRWLVFWISAAVCGLMFFAVTEARWVFPAVFAGINGLIWLVVVLRVRSIEARANRYAPATVIISRHAAEVAGEFHIWQGPFLRLESAGIKGRNPKVLAITYSQWVRYGRSYYTVRIPIPAGEEERAAWVVRQLAADTDE